MMPNERKKNVYNKEGIFARTMKKSKNDFMFFFSLVARNNANVNTDRKSVYHVNLNI